MNANELRIGNYLYFPFTKEVVKILGINAYENNNKIENSISFMNGKNLYCEKIEKLQAIDLNKKWFDRFNPDGGFLHLQKEETNTFKYKTVLDLDYESKGLWIWISVDSRFEDDDADYDDNIMSHNLKNIKYVHQLQNLYFALTGEELVVSDAVS